MADSVRIYLEGGPCDGRHVTVETDGHTLPGHACEGVTYEPTERIGHGGSVIYTPQAVQQTPPAEPVHTHATGSWHRLMKASLHDFPHAVQRSKQHLREIRRLARSH